MGDDIFMALDVINAKKTYAKKLRKEPQVKQLPVSEKKVDEFEIPQPLTTKLAVKFLLEGRLKSKVCRYCLNITPGLSELDQIMKIGGTGNIYKVTIRDIVASFHPFKVVDDPNFPNKICQKCVDKALGAYLFTQQCERSERAMLNCFDDMYEKFEKLDPIERPKKRGRQKLNPNFNILHAEHYKVIDYAEPIIHIVNASAEAITKEPELNDLECKKCWQVLPNLESLINHEKIHPRTMWYHCRLCGKSFPKSNQLKRHNNRVHILGKEPTTYPDKDFKCKECCHVTDNFIQHLQHVEKHKFRNVMKHLIEKRMDKLCVVCYNKGTKMMDLDKMVCLHGCHPDLMGDKTLYTLLATTLPDPKSYKYQDLCIPSNASIMTVTKKQNSHLKRKANEMETVVQTISIKEDFQFSNPIIISRKRFKTDHFYYYVFCDPRYLDNVDDNPDPEFFEVVDTCDLEDDNLSTETSVSHEEKTERPGKVVCANYDLNFEGIAEIIMANILSAMFGVVGQKRRTKGNAFVTEITEANINVQNEILYSREFLNDDLKCTNILPITSPNIFSSYRPEIHGECSKSLIPAVTKKRSRKVNAREGIFSNPPPEIVGESSKSLIPAVMKKKGKKLHIPQNKFSNLWPEIVEECSKSLIPVVIKKKGKKLHVLQNIFSNPLPEIVGEYSESLIPAVMKKKGKKLHVLQNIFSNPPPKIVGEYSESLIPAVMKKKGKKLHVLQNIFSNPPPEIVGEYSKSLIPAVMKETCKKLKVPHNIFSNLLFGSVKELDNAHKFELKTVEKVTNDNENLTKDLGQKSILDDTFNDSKIWDQKTNIDENIKCKFCWVFSQIGCCGYCKKPIEGVKNNCPTVKDSIADKVQNTEIKQFHENKIWQCRVCLIDNIAETFTCQCCGNMKSIEQSDVKITFGNNKTFNKKETENEDNLFPKESDDNIKSQPSSSDVNKIIVTEEPSVMDCNDSSEDDKKLETASMISMDTEIATFEETTNTNDTEVMDVEESPIMFNESFNLNNQLLNFNIQTIMDPGVTPIIAGNLQFNMGSGSKNKSLKKFKKSITNVSKAMHK